VLPEKQVEGGGGGGGEEEEEEERTSLQRKYNCNCELGSL
jgi:hypothetical protein